MNPVVKAALDTLKRLRVICPLCQASVALTSTVTYRLHQPKRWPPSESQWTSDFTRRGYSLYRPTPTYCPMVRQSAKENPQYRDALAAATAVMVREGHR